MCSYLFSTKYNKENVEDLNYYLKFRGPDFTNSKFCASNFLYIHNLLSITGSVAPQPFEESDIKILFNGEIYNHKTFGTYNSDGECLIPLYKEYGFEFIKHLDGEFSLCLIDYKNQIAIISSDIFNTKPLFFALENSLGVATYSTPLSKLGYKEIIKIPANTSYKICLKTHKIIETDFVYKFDLTQTKDYYEDWIQAFQDSVKKRTTGISKKLFIGLSAGYDSGLIYLELIKNNTPFYSYTVYGNENENIINQRLKITNHFHKHVKLTYNPSIQKVYKKYIISHSEPYRFEIENSSKTYTENKLLSEDDGAISLARICQFSKKDKCKIFLSGIGSDEIISDYGFNGKKFGPHSNFGGLFPENLNSIFPWPSFYKSTMQSYLSKEEYVCGCYGIEARYPFLDKKVVQEFLLLSASLKNKNYKAPIHYYFKKTNFPFEAGRKTGFSIKF